MPPQLRRPALHDFRAAPTNQRGYLMKNKRKLDDYADQVLMWLLRWADMAVHATSAAHC